MKLKKKVLNAALGLGVLGVIVVGGTFAYLTDSEVAKNSFTVGNVVVDLVKEPGVTDGIQIVPKQKVLINPYAMNTGESSAVIYMEVVLPWVKDMQIAAATGMTADGTTDTELFELIKTDQQTVGFGNDGWTWIFENYYDEDGFVVDGSNQQIASVGYVYGYDKVVLPEMRTPELFESAVVKNFVVNSDEDIALFGDTYLMPIRVYAIQSDYVSGASSSILDRNGQATAVDVDVDNLDYASLRAIFNTFVNQNSNNVMNGIWDNADNSGKLDLTGNPR